MVRSRDEFEAAVAAAGLGIAEIRAFSFFANDPMGLDGPDQAVRGAFHKVRSGVQTILGLKTDAAAKKFFVEFLADVERATIAFARERIADVDLPSQKLVVLKRN